MFIGLGAYSPSLWEEGPATNEFFPKGNAGDASVVRGVAEVDFKKRSAVVRMELPSSGARQAACGDGTSILTSSPSSSPPCPNCYVLQQQMIQLQSQPMEQQNQRGTKNKSGGRPQQEHKRAGEIVFEVEADAGEQRRTRRAIGRAIERDGGTGGPVKVGEMGARCSWIRGIASGSL